LGSLAEAFGRLLLVNSSSVNGYWEVFHRRKAKRRVTEREVTDFGAAPVEHRREERGELALVDGEHCVQKSQERDLKKFIYLSFLNRVD